MKTEQNKPAKSAITLPAEACGVRLLLASSLLLLPSIHAVAAADATLTVTAKAGESVTAPSGGIVAKESAAGTKSATPLRKTPQAISVVTREQMDDQRPASVADALRYTSGVVTNYRGNSNRNDEVISRGFRYAPKLLDGLHFGLSSENGGAGQFDPWLLERVEMVHGPASVLYGQVSPGGLLVMTSKRPTAESIHEVKLSTGNHHLGEAAFDFGGRLNDDNTLFYRLNGIGSIKHEEVKGNKQQRIAIAPAITWLPNEDTSFTLLTSYQYEPNAGSRNFLPALGTLLPTSVGYIPYDYNVNANDPEYYKSHRRQLSIGYELDHNFNEELSFQQNLRYTHRDEDYKYIVYTFNDDANDHTIGRRPQHETALTNEVGVDNHLKGLFATGDVQHTVLGGVDYRYSHVNTRITRQDADYTDWSNPVDIDVNESAFYTSLDTQKTLNQVGVYLQDQLEWNRFNLLISGRNDWSQGRLWDRTSGGTDKTVNDSKFTYRTGLLYAFDSGVSPYVSYSTSFEPVLENARPGSGPLKPTTGKQAEIGVKYQPTGSDAMITVSLFDIEQKNVADFYWDSALATSYYRQIGKVRSKGVETELHAQPVPEVKLTAAYTYTAVVTKESVDASQVGHSPAAIPRHAASAWGSYSVLNGPLDGLTLGAGVRYTGTAPGSDDGVYTVPHYTLYDAMAQYELGKAVPSLRGATLQLNVQNLSDKHYVASCSGDSACFYGTGRSVITSVDYKW